MKNILDIINLPRTLLISLTITLLFCSINLAYADYNDDVNVGNTSAQEMGDAIYRTGGWSYNHAGIYYLFTGVNHWIIHVVGDDWYDSFNPWYHIVQMDKLDDFKGDETYLGSYTSETHLTEEERNAIIRTAEQLRDRSDPIHYTVWGQLDGEWDEWDGTIDDIDNLRCDGLVEVAYEMNEIDVWGKNQTNYSIVDYTDEHNNAPSPGFEPDPNVEVCPVVQRGGYDTEEDQYTKLRASVPEPPDIIIDSPLEGTEQTGLFKITALPEDESGIRHVIFEYSTDYANWSPLPGPDSSTGKDGYEADGWGLRFDTVSAGIGDSQVWVRANATDKAGNTSDWTETYYFVNNVSITVSITFDPSSPTAGSPVTVSGHAEYQDGQPVQSGSVEILTSSGLWTTTTDSYGDYSREITAPGGSSYVYVTVSHDNYLGSAAEWLTISGGSHVSGTLTNDTTWTAGGSPYVVTGSLSIPEGVTLTINPGTVVKFDHVYADLTVHGTLLAQGTSDAPIVFTSLKDDSYGGDTNGNGDATTPADRDWEGILLLSTSGSSHMEHCVVKYAGYSYSDYKLAGIYCDGASPAITNCEISNNGTYGIRCENSSSPVIDGASISNHTYGILADSSCSPTIVNCTFTDHSQKAVSLAGGVLSNLENNLASGGQQAGICINGNVVSNATLKNNPGMPYIFGSLSVAEGVTLTINPGTVVKFDHVYADLTVHGTLLAQGTSDAPIVFTSLKDDSYGGDTNGNGDATTPADRDWEGILLLSTSGSSHMEHCVVKYAGYSYSDYKLAGIYCDGASPAITNCEISNNGTYGIRCENSSSPVIDGASISNHTYGILADSSCSPTIVNCTFFDNSSFAVKSSNTTAAINAKQNNWGHISGPLDSSDDRGSGGLYNPSGQGQKVSDHVDYYPWTGTTIGVTAVPSGLSSTPGNGAINLQWNANAETYLGGYKIYCGTTSVSYGTPIVLGKVTSHKLTGLTNDTPYYIAISSMNSVGAESVKSAEVIEIPIDDQDAPSSIITHPTDGEEISGETYTITGTADDADGTGVQKVEISTDGGESWNPATGNTSWSYAWTLPGPGIYNIKSRATDNAENVETPGDGVTVTVIEIQAPTVTTGSATSVTSTSATLNGTVNPNGAETEVVFEWGEDDSYGNEVTATQSPLTGVTEQAVSTGLSELTPGRFYHFRVKATNSEGTTYGADQTFCTSMVCISIQKFANNMNPDMDEDVVFTITLINNGPSDVTGLQVTDILSSGLSYVSDTSGGSYDPVAGIWAVDSLSATPPDNTASLDVTATVIQEGEILNIASVTDCYITDPDISNNSSALLLSGGNQADLGIAVAVDNPAPNLGDEVTFTVTLTNNGSDNATGLQVIDLLPVNLTYQSSTSSQGSYDPGTGIWDVGNLDCGESVTLDLVADVNSEDETINTARITHNDQTDPDVSNNSSSSVINQDMVNHPYLVDLAVQKRVNLSKVNVGDQVVFTVVVRNNGPDNAGNVEIYDLLPEALTFVLSEPSQGIYDEQTGIWDVGMIPSSSYVLMDVVALLAVAQPVTNTATVNSVEEYDIAATNDSASAAVEVSSGARPDIKANGLDDPLFVTPSESVDISISLDPGDMAGVSADWWGILLSSYGTFPLFGFQAPLFELPDTSLFSRPWPMGWYIFLFGLDDTPDGAFELDWYDYVVVVSQPAGAGAEELPDFDAIVKDAIVKEKMRGLIGK